jgi:hypothetical protein
MSGNRNKMTKRHARPIKTERDYKGAVSVAEKIRKQTEREQAEEHRLQGLIHAMEKFDDQGDEEDTGDVTDDIVDLPRRRWSDEGEDGDQ